MEPQDGGFRDPRPAADLRDRAGQQRDDAADARDEVSGTRDEAAATRDRAARARDVTAGHDADGVLDRFGRLRGRIVERLRRIEDDDVDPAQWRGLDVATLARLRTEAAGRRRGVAQDRLDLEALMDELVRVLTRGRGDRDSGAGDRQQAQCDRWASAGDRGASAGDRDAAAGDRDQAVLVREQVGSGVAPEVAALAAEAEHAAAGPIPAVVRAIADSGERIIQSRRVLDRPERQPPTGEATVADPVRRS